MTTKKESEENLEYFIEDWHWDNKSHEFARQMALFLFDFFNYLRENGLSVRTLRKHEGNCELIAGFTAGYGYYDEFTPEVFIGEPDYLSEFKRKVSKSKNAIESYKTTWRKLAKYADTKIKNDA